MLEWSLFDGSGIEVGHSPHFTDAEAAEDWIGSSWRDLMESGVEEVVLFDRQRGQRLYRMGLGAE
jgi:hypothetical protein